MINLFIEKKILYMFLELKIPQIINIKIKHKNYLFTNFIDFKTKNMYQEATFKTYYDIIVQS